MHDPDIKLNNFLEEEKRYIEDLKKIDLDKNWNRFNRTLTEKSSRLRVFPFSYKYRVLIRTAAAAILLLLVATTLYFTTYLPTQHIIQARAEPGHTDIRLSDGTDISLKEGAVLYYPEKLKRRTREVTLSGEAFFDVRQAEKSPFIVYVGEMTVRVIGTSFNIRQDAGGSIEVSVIDGEVNFFESGKVDEGIRITAGQRGIYNSEKRILNTEKSDSENFLFWKTGILEYKDTPLSEVIKELEYHFDQKIIVKDPDFLQNRWNSVHQGQPLNEILEELCLYFDLECFASNDTILVQRKTL
jgi:ferric-dicitrate binding protein FerR (iron transport regulator)